MKFVTQRLVLHELWENDLEALFALHSDTVFQRYLGRPPNKEEAGLELRAVLERAQREPREQYNMAVTIALEDRLCGYIYLKENNPSIREWEIGWGMHPSLWGKGYTSEAAREILRFAFGKLNAHRVVAFCHVNNLASTRVMEKLGMEREGRLRKVRWQDEQWWDEFIYSILEQAWNC